MKAVKLANNSNSSNSFDFFFLSAGDWTQHLAHTRHGSELASAFPDAVFMVFWMVLLLDYPRIGDCKSKQIQNPCPVQNFNY